MKPIAYPYYRVSTQRQGRSGLGLAAQRLAVEAYARQHNLRLGKAYIEIESGRNNKRPVLEKALQSCKANRGVLLIAKLDRLSRNVHFITSLMEAKVDFKAVDVPEANKLLLQMLAVIAEYEHDQILQRTKAAFQAAKSRGKIYGEYARTVTGPRNKQRSIDFAMRMRLVIWRLNKDGFTTMRALSDELNRRQIPTHYPGHRWHAASVCTLLQHIKTLQPIGASANS